MSKIAFVFTLLFLLTCKPSPSSSEARLENTYWKLVEAYDSVIRTPDGSREIHMVLTLEEKERKLQGFAGCNSLGGNYTVNSNNIHVEAITTRMFCEQRMEDENLFMRLLQEATAYKIKGEVLILYNGTLMIGRFESVYLP
jgi:heat shock protein HslJ